MISSLLPKPLRSRLSPVLDLPLVPVMTAVFLGVLLSTMVAYFYTRATVQNLAEQRMTQDLQHLDRALDARAKAMLYHLDLLAQEEMLRLTLEDSYLGQSARTAAQPKLAARILSGAFDRLLVLNTKGQVIISSDPKMIGSTYIGDRDYYLRALRGEKSRETIISRVSGRPSLAAAAPLAGPDGAVVGVLTAAKDTDHFSREVLDAVRVGDTGGAYVLDQHGVLIASPSWAAKGQFVPGESGPQLLEAAQNGEVVRYSPGNTERLAVARINRETGWCLVVEADSAEVLKPATRLAALTGVISFCTLALVALALGMLRRTMADLRLSEEKFSRLFRLSPDRITLSELATGRIIDVNEAFTRDTGISREEALRLTILEAGLVRDTPANTEMHERLLRDGHVENLEQEVLHRNGSSSTYSISLQLMDIAGKRHVMSIARDITAMKKMQEVMVQTEKMISVGGIAAGIAHEINNPLGIVLQAAQTLAQRANPSLKKNQEAAQALGLDMGLLEQYFQVRKLHIFIEDIQSAALRASTIIRHMLDFSRKSESRRNACQIQSIIDKALELAKNDYDLKKSYDFKNISITKHYADNLPEIDCTETEIEQVFLNLLRNAAQAMAQASPPVEQPRIDIRVSAQPEGGKPDRVRVDLTDNGPGMPEDVRRRVFEPFYTTKAPGIGTGLGLSVSYFIITKGHGGTMTVESRPGEGARFRLELPTDALKERTT